MSKRVTSSAIRRKVGKSFGWFGRARQALSADRRDFIRWRVKIEIAPLQNRIVPLWSQRKTGLRWQDLGCSALLLRHMPNSNAASVFFCFRRTIRPKELLGLDKLTMRSTARKKTIFLDSESRLKTWHTWKSFAFQNDSPNLIFFNSFYFIFIYLFHKIEFKHKI